MDDLNFVGGQQCMQEQLLEYFYKQWFDMCSRENREFL